MSGAKWSWKWAQREKEKLPETILKINNRRFLKRSLCQPPSGRRLLLITTTETKRRRLHLLKRTASGLGTTCPSLCRGWGNMIYCISFLSFFIYITLRGSWTAEFHYWFHSYPSPPKKKKNLNPNWFQQAGNTPALIGVPGSERVTV